MFGSNRVSGVQVFLCVYNLVATLPSSHSVSSSLPGNMFKSLFYSLVLLAAVLFYTEAASIEIVEVEGSETSETSKTFNRSGSSESESSESGSSESESSESDSSESESSESESAEEPESRFFFLALAKARCFTTCSAVSFASTTSCTLIFSTLPCNVIFPLQAAAAG